MTSNICERLVFRAESLVESMRLAADWIEKNIENHEIYSIQIIDERVILFVDI
jgi:hypothetical protein